MARLGTETAFEVLARARALEAKGRSVIHLEIGEPDFDTPGNIVDAGVKALRGGATHYGPSAGLPEAREAYAQYFSKDRGVTVSPEQIVITPGAKPILYFVITALVDEGDEAIYPNPGFPIYESVIDFVGAKAVPLPLREENDFRIDHDELRKLANSKTKLIILNTPQNPTGGVLTYEDLAVVAEVAKANDAWVLADEIYSKIIYEGEHHSLLEFDGMAERTIVLDGHSKTYAMTGWRLGFGVMPAELSPFVAKLMTNVNSCTASFTQLAGIEALLGDQSGAKAMVSEFRARRDLLVGELNEIPGVSCKLPGGAFYVFPNIKELGISVSDFATTLLDEFGVASLAGTSFGRFGDGYLRFSYANSQDNCGPASTLWESEERVGANVLIVGSGGREHALAWRLSRSPTVGTVYVAPGSDGMADVAELVAANDHQSWLGAATDLRADLVVIGPEAPLVDGLGDELRRRDFAVFGPSRDGARLEGDKAYAKEFLEEFGIPTARSVHFDQLAPALAYLKEHPGACVVKATGLAAGKGVSVCDDELGAERAVRLCLEEGVFGQAGASVLIEERLVGPELSVFAVLDGHRLAWFAPSRDHKRIGDGDTGPNTGGMGAYTPVADATPELMAEVSQSILQPSLAGLRSRGIDFRGLLYVGLMLTPEGPKVLEYNCRFGDPETQVVLPTYDGDLFELLLGAARGELPCTGALPTTGAAVGVVLASRGYPAGSEKGVAIPGLDDLGERDLVFHAGTRREQGSWLTNGGRVLCAVAAAPSLGPARDSAQALADRLLFPGAQRRRDIARQEE
jgi:phosphoribosylamine--glycine ligase